MLFRSEAEGRGRLAKRQHPRCRGVLARLAIKPQGHVAPGTIEQPDAQRDMQRRVAGFARRLRDAQIVGPARGVVFAPEQHDLGAVDMGIGQIRLESDGLGEMGSRLIQISKIHVGFPHIVVGENRGRG